MSNPSLAPLYLTPSQYLMSHCTPFSMLEQYLVTHYPILPHSALLLGLHAMFYDPPFSPNLGQCLLILQESVWRSLHYPLLNPPQHNVWTPSIIPL